MDQYDHPTVNPPTQTAANEISLSPSVADSGRGALISFRHAALATLASFHCGLRGHGLRKGSHPGPAAHIRVSLTPMELVTLLV